MAPRTAFWLGTQGKKCDLLKQGQVWCHDWSNNAANMYLSVSFGTEVECSVLGVSAWELAVGVALMRLETFVSYHWCGSFYFEFFFLAILFASPIWLAYLSCLRRAMMKYMVQGSSPMTNCWVCLATEPYSWTSLDGAQEYNDKQQEQNDRRAHDPNAAGAGVFQLGTRPSRAWPKDLALVANTRVRSTRVRLQFSCITFGGTCAALILCVLESTLESRLFERCSSTGVSAGVSPAVRHLITCM